MCTHPGVEERSNKELSSSHRLIFCEKTVIEHRDWEYTFLKSLVVLFPSHSLCLVSGTGLIEIHPLKQT